MQDDKGLYYYPFPQNKQARMYVRETRGEIEFRLWNQVDEKLWNEHGWVPYDAIKQAQKIYNGKGFEPDQVYNLVLARQLIRDD